MNAQHDDVIDEIISNKNKTSNIQICNYYSAENCFAHRICKACAKEILSKIQFELNHNEPISHATNLVGAIEMYKNSANIYCGEPDLINPSRYEAISQILRNRGRKAGIKKYVPNAKWEWLFVEVDGTVHNIVQQLIADVFRCDNCDEVFFDCPDSHGCNSGKSREFDWIVLFPGIASSSSIVAVYCLTLCFGQIILLDHFYIVTPKFNVFKTSFVKLLLPVNNIVACIGRVCTIRPLNFHTCFEAES